MITGPELFEALVVIQNRDARETAHRVLQRCRRIYGYANAMNYTEKDPTRGLKEALAPAKGKHFAALTEPKQVGGLMRAIHSYNHPITQQALFMSAYTFVRPGELRKAEWSEIDVNNRMWKIPEHKMKMRKPHLVPLATQVLSLLDTLKILTSNSPYLFPSIRSKSKPMSEATITAALRRMDYEKASDDRTWISAHGINIIK